MIFDVYLKFTYILFVNELQVQNPTNITNAKFVYVFVTLVHAKTTEIGMKFGR